MTNLVTPGKRAQTLSLSAQFLFGAVFFSTQCNLNGSFICFFSLILFGTKIGARACSKCTVRSKQYRPAYMEWNGMEWYHLQYHLLLCKWCIFAHQSTGKVRQNATQFQRTTIFFVDFIDGRFFFLSLSISFKHNGRKKLQQLSKYPVASVKQNRL